MHTLSKRINLLSIALLLLFVTARPPMTHAADDAKTQVSFCAMGDVPRSPEEETLLRQQLAELPTDTDFVIHVGDIKSGKSPCDEAVYEQVAGILTKATIPVFIIPGDNEWNDCADPGQAWTFWEKHFMRFDRHWQHDFSVFRQLEREENFSFVRGDVLFIAINIVGGRVHDAQEWSQRLAQDLEWTRRNLRHFGDSVSSSVVFGHALPAARHAEFFDGFVKEAEQFGKPLLYLHGDGHRWIHDHPFPAKNVLRVQVDQGSLAPPLKVTITNDTHEPFHFDRRM